MKRREMMLAAGAAAFGVSAFPTRWAFPSGRKRRKILFFTRNVGYYHSVVQRKRSAPSHSERMLTDMASRVGIDVICTKDGGVFDEPLDAYDAIAFFTNGDLTLPNPQKEPPMSTGGKQRLLDAIAAGKGFIGFHSTCGSWRTPPAKDGTASVIDPFIAMVGGEFVAHGPQQVAAMQVVSPEFPGMAHLGKSFKLQEEWYALKNFAADLHAILVQQTAGMRGGCYERPPYPSTWARKHHKGRVFFTSMAHREDTWSRQPFQQIVLGGLAWVLGDAEADVAPNMKQVAPRASEMPS